MIRYIEAPAHVLKAYPRGDRLRTRLARLPRQERLADLASAEEAAARTQLLLDNLAREHEANLARVQEARDALRLTPPAEAPAVQAPAGAADPAQPQPEHITLLGRVVRRDPFTALTKATGHLELAGGGLLRWKASAAYVDTLDDLFGGAPLVVTAHMPDPAGRVVIQAVRPASEDEWPGSTEGLRFVSYTQQVPEVVAGRTHAKKKLAAARGLRCEKCATELANHRQASVLNRESGPLLMCRPCKQTAMEAA